VINLELKVQFHHDKSGFCTDVYYNKKLNRFYCRVGSEHNEWVSWYTTNEWQGYFEPDCPLKERLTVIFEINGKEYQETIERGGLCAKKNGPFSWEPLKEEQ
jgi:hypothetical protein